MSGIDSSTNVPTSKDLTNHTIRVMLVDDHPAILYAIPNWLEMVQGIELVHACSKSTEVMDGVKHYMPDIVLVDLQLDDSPMDGFQVIEQIRTLESPPKVLVLSAYYDPKRVFAAVNAGIDGYMVKSATENAIIHAIQSVYYGHNALDPKVMNVLQRYVSAHHGNIPEAYLAQDMETLTPQQITVLDHISLGKTNDEIAELLFIESSTVKRHVHDILNRLGLKDRNQAAVWYFMHHDNSDSN